MTASLVAACLWVVAAAIVTLVPSKRAHWPQAYALIAVGLPILVWVAVQNGPLAGAIALAAFASVLRWPVIYLWRWLSARF